MLAAEYVPTMVSIAATKFLTDPVGTTNAANELVSALTPGPNAEAIPISARNLSHLDRHLPEFQKLDPSMTRESVVALGRSIAGEAKNFLKVEGGRGVYQKIVTIGEQKVLVRVVLNPQGGIRSIHIRY